VKNVIQELETSVVLHVATPTVNSRELTKNADLPQELATNSPDASGEPAPPDSADPPLSSDQTPDALFLEPPRENVTEAEFVYENLLFKQKFGEARLILSILFCFSNSNTFYKNINL